jgi:hypothetical protein
VRTKAILLTAISFAVFSSALAGTCPQCQTDNGTDFVQLPPSCVAEVRLVIENSNAYGPQDLKRILPYVEQANRHFYRCENYDIAVGDDITVVVDRDTGVIYLTRYVFSPQGE